MFGFRQENSLTRFCEKRGFHDKVCPLLKWDMVMNVDWNATNPYVFRVKIMLMQSDGSSETLCVYSRKNSNHYPDTEVPLFLFENCSVYAQIESEENNGEVVFQCARFSNPRKKLKWRQKYDNIDWNGFVIMGNCISRPK